jgi:deferrochelatase/peroxidase EfeB
MVAINRPLDLDEPGAEVFLEGLQGNIIKAHGRSHTAHVFVTFPVNPIELRPWIASFAKNRVTTAALQRAQSRAWRQDGGPGEPFQMILLSNLGFRGLGIDPDQTPNDLFFRAGLKRHNDVGMDQFNDPDKALWEQPFQVDLHAMILLAHNDRSALDALVTQTVYELEAIGCVSYVERGDKLRYDFGSPRGTLDIEHFGHQDGISDPRMVVEDIRSEVEMRGATKWDPSAPLELVLVAEPGSTETYGSYMVFRKLEQNVRRFRAEVSALAFKLGVDTERAAALVVGRYRDGTPTIPSVTSNAAADPNDFDFSEDRPEPPAAARLCPFQAHIRRSNPRGDIPHYTGNSAAAEFERGMRIARRGITYGERPNLYDPDPDKQPQDGVGLLFMSFQANLRQFAIQQAGSDNDTFPYSFSAYSDPFTGIDAVIGQAVDLASARSQLWPVGSATGSVEATHSMMNFVTLKGGEYFFAPSMSFLKSL